MDTIWIMILIVFFLLVVLLKFWQFNRTRNVWEAESLFPTWNEIKSILTYKQKKKFYEEGFADEPDEEEQK